MNLNKLEKATNVLSLIKQIDAEIIELDKFAMMIASGENKPSFELKLLDIKKVQEEEKKSILTEDGSLSDDEAFNPMRGLMFRWREEPEKPKNRNEHILAYDLSELVTLQIMGVMLCEKKDRRANLLRQLHSYGVES